MRYTPVSPSNPAGAPDKLAVRGGDVLADVVGADGQLSVASVDQHRELYRARAAAAEHRFNGGSGRAPGVSTSSQRTTSLSFTSKGSSALRMTGLSASVERSSR